jgi:cell division protein FtsB
VNFLSQSAENHVQQWHASINRTRPLPDSMIAMPTPRRKGARSRAIGRDAKRRWIQYALLFCTAALVVNALIGDRGLTALVRVQRDYAGLRASLEAIRRDNAALRDEIRRLDSDPKAIEEAARRDLGLAHKDELLFIVKDVPAPRPR